VQIAEPSKLITSGSGVPSSFRDVRGGFVPEFVNVGSRLINSGSVVLEHPRCARKAPQAPMIFLTWGGTRMSKSDVKRANRDND
jgi:hypothetical protein